DQRRVVEYILSDRGVDQETDVEPLPRDVAGESQGEVRIGVADHAVVAGVRVAPDCRFPTDASRSGRRAEELLLAVRVDADEHGTVERTQGIPRAITRSAGVADHDAL